MKKTTTPEVRAEKALAEKDLTAQVRAEPTLPGGLATRRVLSRQANSRREWVIALAALVSASLAGLTYAGDKGREAPGFNTRTLLVVGDSISAEYGLARGTGWVALLQERLAASHPSWRVVNASISGETSAGGLTRMPRLLERQAPDLVILELGANDALRGLALESTRANLAAMVRASREAGAAVLLAGMQVPPNYGKAYTTEFANLFRSLADEFDTALVPFLLSAIATDLARFQADRIHPNADAQPLMLDTVWPALEPLLQAPAAADSGSGSRRRN